MSELPPLDGILETVLYHGPDNEDEMHRFYSEALGLPRVSQWAYRLGDRVLLLFDASATRDQQWPPAHGATGPGHVCFTVPPEGYENWKQHLAARSIEIIEEIDWSRGVHSFYFRDPAGNVLEIANGDMWPA